METARSCGPQPDIAVLRRRPVPYKEREAWAEDALLIIEVADSSLVEVHRRPGPEGYRDISRVAGTATLTLLAFPDVELTTTEIFA